MVDSRRADIPLFACGNKITIPLFPDNLHCHHDFLVSYPNIVILSQTASGFCYDLQECLSKRRVFILTLIWARTILLTRK